MQQSSLLGQRGVHYKVTPAQKSRLPVAAVRSVTRPATRPGPLPGNITFSPATFLGLRKPCSLAAIGQQHVKCQPCSHPMADPVASKPLTGRLWPLLQIMAAICCLPFLMNLWAQASQQWCMLSLAGVLLPLQSHSGRQAVNRFQHALQAAAAVEAETENESPEPQGEEPNDNTIVETGAELGNVQTPASVWLPYSTSGPGKVCLQDTGCRCTYAIATVHAMLNIYHVHIASTALTKSQMAGGTPQHCLLNAVLTNNVARQVTPMHLFSTDDNPYRLHREQCGAMLGRHPGNSCHSLSAGGNNSQSW